MIKQFNGCIVGALHMSVIILDAAGLLMIFVSLFAVLSWVRTTPNVALDPATLAVLEAAYPVP
jgi:hypothetical protein